MLYMTNDGNLVIDDKPMPYDPEWEAEKRRLVRERKAENQRRYEEMRELAAIAELKRELTEFDAELEAWDGDDATEWERFPEMERVMYALGELEVMRDLRISDEVAERDELIEFVELAEEDARCQLNVYGCLEFEPQFDWSRKSTPEERGWSRAVLDIIDFEGAANAESLFELM